jgi:serine protease inhibitor
MMANSEKVYYYGDKKRGAKVLGLPYKDSESVMYMVLPDKDLKTFVSHLTPADLQEFISAGGVTSVSIEYFNHRGTTFLPHRPLLVLHFLLHTPIITILNNRIF